jgi:hypothetical protein
MLDTGLVTSCRPSALCAHPIRGPNDQRQWAKRQSPRRSIRQGDHLGSTAAVNRFVGQPLRHRHPPQPDPCQPRPPPGPPQPGPRQPGPPQPGPRQPRPPQPGPCQPGPPQPGPPQPRPPQPGPPGPCQPGPPQPANCTCWTTPGAAGGVGAALATPASPIAEKPSAPAIAPVPMIFFRVMAIPFLLLFTPRRPGRVVGRQTASDMALVETLRCSSQLFLPPRATVTSLCGQRRRPCARARKRMVTCLQTRARSRRLIR